jgi:hypothetical protein
MSAKWVINPCLKKKSSSTNHVPKEKRTNTMKKEFRLAFVLTLLSLAMVHGTAIASEPGDTSARISPTLELTYWCNANDSATLTGRIYFTREKEMICLKNAVITFTATDGKKTAPLGMAVADSTGNAVVTFATSSLPSKEGIITYNADFTGSGKYEPATASFSAKPAKIEVSFYEQDSVRYIKVTGTVKDQKGNSVPFADQAVKIYVPSLFRLLPIGEITLDKDGAGTMEFPKTLIGDSLGNITVMAQVEENDVYGNVVAKNNIPWAIPKHSIQAERPSRELWTPVAPIWMIITLIILLAGVWAHYVYAVVQLVKIKRSSKQDPYSR